jgi:hypothetical protein
MGKFNFMKGADALDKNIEFTLLLKNWWYMRRKSNIHLS